MTYRPTPALAANDPKLIHSSTFTTLSTNAGVAGRHRNTFRVTKCEIRWLDGDVAVRFTGHELDVTPRRSLAAGSGR